MSVGNRNGYAAAQVGAAILGALVVLLIAGGRAQADLWVVIPAPLAGGVVAGLAHAARLTRA